MILEDDMERAGAYSESWKTQDYDLITQKENGISYIEGAMQRLNLSRPVERNHHRQ